MTHSPLVFYLLDLASHQNRTPSTMQLTEEHSSWMETYYPPTPPESPIDGWIEHPVAVIASSNVVLEGQLTPATIVISKITGKIIAILESIVDADLFQNGTYTDYSPHFILPGLVDAHVHLNEPGRTEWEGFHTGTRAAAFGGVTTVVDMPLNAIPPTTTVANLDQKIRAAQGKCWVDVGFYGGMIPGNTADLKPLIRAGVRGFKAFMIDSGVEEFPAVSLEDISACFQELAHEDTIVMFHAEAHHGHDQIVPPAPYDSPKEYQTFLESRPPQLETTAVEDILSRVHLAPSLPVHIVHLSAVESIPLIRRARARGINITAETCPHYLALAAEQVQKGDTRYKCCPPIRAQSNQDELWEELLDPEGVMQTVVSDHSPCTPDLKLLPQADSEKVVDDHDNGDFFKAWGGISSVGLTLPILWTEMTRRHLTHDLSKAISAIVRWCCINTALQVGLASTKGDLRVGMDADICIFDPTAEWSVDHGTMLFRNKTSPYQGTIMKGMVRETWLRGERIFVRGGANDGFCEIAPRGELLLEPRGKFDSVVRMKRL